MTETIPQRHWAVELMAWDLRSQLTDSVFNSHLFCSSPQLSSTHLKLQLQEGGEPRRQ